jgi:hypothetical protein
MPAKAHVTRVRGSGSWLRKSHAWLSDLAIREGGGELEAAKRG